MLHLTIAETIGTLEIKFRAVRVPAYLALVEVVGVLAGNVV